MKITTTQIRQTVVAQAVEQARRECVFLFVYEFKDMFDHNVWAVLTNEEQHPKDSLLLCTINHKGQVESTIDDLVVPTKTLPYPGFDRKILMTLTTDETLEIGLNRLIYAAQLISRHFQKGGELFDTLNNGYPFNESFDEVLNALVQWRDSACNKQTHLLPHRISLRESNLEHAARNVLENWDTGDLAGAIMQLSNALP